MRSLQNKCKWRPVKAPKAVEDEKCTNNFHIEVLMMKYQSLIRVLTLTVQLIIETQAAVYYLGPKMILARIQTHVTFDQGMPGGKPDHA